MPKRAECASLSSMLLSTLDALKCPACNEEHLSYEGRSAQPDIDSGTIRCKSCSQTYPILAGVLVLVSDVRGYLLEHVKGIARLVDDTSIPKEHRAAFLKAKRQLVTEHIEEDLEAERVTALYVMNHYLMAREVRSPDTVIQGLIEKHWDHGPFAHIRGKLEKSSEKPAFVELGCGVGGLYARLRGQVKSYLGLDSSFASIATARHLALGARMHGKILVPDDLLHGPVSRELTLPHQGALDESADFIVCDLAQPPIRNGIWDMAAALNVIDMLPDPSALPSLQHALLKKGGLAIQSSPYVWHQDIAAELRSQLPKNLNDSAAAIEWLYESHGFKITTSEKHVPWLFFKQTRQLELYSVHLFFAAKKL